MPGESGMVRSSSRGELAPPPKLLQTPALDEDGHEAADKWSNRAPGQPAAAAADAKGTPSAEADDNHFAEMLEDLFPRAVPEQVFVKHMSSVLNNHGFKKDTSINLVSTCRDELCRSLTDLLDSEWNPHFSISSLAGFVFCGRTGFKAAMAHAPVVNGKERYVFWVAPHIALSADGQVGKCFRPHRRDASSACGALLGVLAELKSGKMSLRLDQTDIEQSLVKQELVGHLPYGHLPTLVELTYAAYDCILKEIKETAAVSIHPSNCEYAIVAGIQIHGPGGQNFFWPGMMSTYDGTGFKVDMYEEYATAVNEWHVNLQGWNASEALMLLQKRRREARLAAKTGDVEKLKRVPISLGGIRDHSHRTLLHVAAIYNQLEVAKHLITEDPSLIGQYDLDKCSAMDYAVDNHFDDVARLIKSYGGGIEGQHLFEGLMASVERLDLESFERYVKFAKDKEEALSARDKDGRSLVHICMDIRKQTEAEQLKQERIIQELIAFGADGNAVDHYGNDVLHHAPEAKRKSFEMMRQT
uniref:Limiting CO2-inducible protein B/C beta carbonyic anhydrase domain-containing protein n=1 Tax=Hemiselmis andersenii TaxID=464988 RepID=A0A6U2HGA8_HEMAN|mmetsp:Transcript_40218/g.94163  ORF Transcript_40218/g.94163 Transcript_40218/m.94163 type:complete len:528 (+) Transcript_40218:121-1704(+)